MRYEQWLFVLFLTVEHLLDSLGIFEEFSTLWVIPLPENSNSQHPLQPHYLALSKVSFHHMSSLGQKLQKFPLPRTTRNSPHTQFNNFLGRKSALSNQKTFMWHILKAKRLFILFLCKCLCEYLFRFILYLVLWFPLFSKHIFKSYQTRILICCYSLYLQNMYLNLLSSVHSGFNYLGEQGPSFCVCRRQHWRGTMGRMCPPRIHVLKL